MKYKAFVKNVQLLYEISGLDDGVDATVGSGTGSDTDSDAGSIDDEITDPGISIESIQLSSQILTNLLDKTGRLREKDVREAIHSAVKASPDGTQSDVEDILMSVIINSLAELYLQEKSTITQDLENIMNPSITKKPSTIASLVRDICNQANDADGGELKGILKKEIEGLDKMMKREIDYIEGEHKKHTTRRPSS